MILFWLWASCTKTNAPLEPPGSPKMECTVRVAAGEDLASKLTAGAVVCLGAGEHVGPFTVEQSVTIVGDAGAVLTSHGRGPVVTVVAHQITVTLKGVTITDGYAETGSGLFVDAYSNLVLDGCTIEGNREGTGPGRGLWMVMGDLVARDTTFTDDVVITGIAKARFEGSKLGALAVGDGSEVAVSGGSVAHLSVAGTTSRAPVVTLLAAAKVAKIENDPDVPGRISGP